MKKVIVFFLTQSIEQMHIFIPLQFFVLWEIEISLSLVLTLVGVTKLHRAQGVVSALGTSYRKPGQIAIFLLGPGNGEGQM